MTCYFCRDRIEPGDAINYHHPVLRSEGGTHTEPTHKACHVEHHSTQGQYAEWGRKGGQISALDKHWAFHLRNVKTHPAYDVARQFNHAYYAH